MVGKQIKKYRLEQNLSLSELAKRADVSKSYLSAIERNIHTNPSIQYLGKIASVLAVPVERLLRGGYPVAHYNELSGE